MKLVVIGGVAAGMSAASKVKRLLPDCDVVALEKGTEVSYGACGLPYYISGENEDEDLLRIRKADQFRRQGIELRTRHEVRRLDAEDRMLYVTDLETGREYTERYDKLMVASGASAIVPKLSGAALKNIFTLRTIEDANAIKTAAKCAGNVAVIGAGYIGVELADAFRRLGLHVTLIERENSVLPGLDAEITELVREELLRNGVELKLGCSVTGFCGKDKLEAVELEDGTVPADMAVIAIGVRPNTGFIKDTGVAMLANGAIVTNRFMETSLPDVYAGGDCASVWHKILEKNMYIPLGTNANKQGRLAGENISGGHREFSGALGTAMIRAFGLEVGSAGVTSAQAEAAGLNVKSCVVTALSGAPYYPGHQPITAKLLYDKDTKVLLGAQLCGATGAALRIDALAACIDARMTTDHIGMMDFGYAPPFASVWDVIHIAANAAK